MKRINMYKYILCLITTLVVFNQASYAKSTLEPRKLNNLEIFSEIYGIIRFYDPSLGIDTMMHWEDWLLEHIPSVENAKNEDELITIISKAFTRINPSILVRASKKNLPSLINNKTGDSLVRRKNIGFGHRGENTIKMKFIYFSELILTDTPEFYTHKIGNIKVTFPLTSYIGDTTLRIAAKNKIFNPNDKLDKYSIEDKNVRLAIIIEVCNVMRHFYPYSEQMQINHGDIQRRYLNRAALNQNNTDFSILLDELSAEYKDGHAAFMPFVKYIDWPDYVPEIGVKNFDNKLYISYTSDSLKNFIQIGDEVAKINNFNAYEFFKQKQKRVSGATVGWIDFLSEKELLMGVRNTLVNLELIRNGRRYIMTLTRTLKVDVNQKNIAQRPDLKEIKEGYYYVNLFGLNDSALSHIMNNYLYTAKGIVFDVRGYPRTSMNSLLSHLTSDTLLSNPFSAPYKLSPNGANLYHQFNRWNIAPQTPKITSNIVFIVDGRCISAAESYLAIVEQNKLGKFVGQNTAGTNGNINSFQVFGLFQLWYTNMYVPTYNGQCFHGVGIKPQVKVESTYTDLINGKDPFLEAAIKVLN